MLHKNYPLRADTVASMTAFAFIECLDFDADILFCFTPAGIREAIARDKELGEVLKDALHEMFQNDKGNVQYARRGFTVPMTFNTRQFARALGKGIGTNSLKALKAVLTRLKAATFFVETTCPHFIDNLKCYFPEVKAIQNATTQVAITFNMLAEYVEADQGKEFSVTLGRAVRALIGNRVSFWFDEALYYSLHGDYAKRLYLLYTSHKDCYPLTRQEIREYFGCSMQSDDDLHTELRKALAQLVEKGVIESGWAYMKHPERGMSYVVNKVKAVVPMVQTKEVAA